MNFTFPECPIPPFFRLEQLKSFINNQLDAENLNMCTRNLYIYCLCRQCSARLVFRKKDDNYQLVKANLHHQHPVIRERRQLIIESFKNFPSCLNVEAIKKMTLARFHISPATFYRYYRKSKSLGADIDSVLTALELDGIFGVKIGSNEQAQFPSILLLTSQIMIQKYHSNRRIVKFDLTYNLVREKTISNRQFALGIFVTQNNSLNIEPVAFVILQDQTKQSFLRVFTEFFYIMRDSPAIIITDQQKAMKFALQQLTERGLFLGHHFVDLFHILRNAKKSIFHKPYMNLLVDLSRSRNIIEYSAQRQVCLTQINGRDTHVLNAFEEKLEKCCIARIPPVFVGLSVSTNSVQKMNDLIKKKLSYSKKYADVVSQLSKILLRTVNTKRQPNIQKMKVELFNVHPEIKSLRSKLCKSVFKRLMLELSYCSTCLIYATQNPNKFFIQEDHFKDDEQFAVEYSNLTGFWQCECELSQKIGLPCSHILKILILRKQKIISAINHWWILEEQPKTLSSRVERPRKTRRH